MSIYSTRISLLVAGIIHTMFSFGQAYTSRYQDIATMQPIMEGYAIKSYGLNFITGSMQPAKVISRKPDGSIDVIKANLLLTNDNGQTEQGWIEMIYDKGLPFGIIESPRPFRCESTVMQINAKGDYFDEYIKQMHEMWLNYVATQRKNTSSYQAVMKIHNSYPSTYNATNSLALVFQRQYIGKKIHYEPVEINTGVFGEKEVSTPQYSTKIFYKNISGHKVVIKGIKRTTLENGKRVYSDASIVLKPGEMTQLDDAQLFPEFSDATFIDGIQYIGDFANIDEENKTVAAEDEKSKASKMHDSPTTTMVFAKRLSTTRIEIDSYTNTSDITIKKGDKVYIYASGSVVTGVFSGASGPKGKSWDNSWNIMPNINYGALLVKIGNGKWQATGDEIILVSETAGKLQFAVNDTDPSDNSGSFIVTYSINKPLTNFSTLKRPEILDVSNYNVKPFLPRKFTGFIINELDSTANCASTLSLKNDGTYKLYGTINFTEFIGKMDLTGQEGISNNKRIYRFTGYIYDNARDKSKEMKFDFAINVEITPQGIKGTYELGDELKSYGTINLH